ncbi:allophanate hydrolase subunit 1 [Pseudonocardia sp. C8]|uniref:5-oxoprolinase subunit B family protein n=1 Tax=Pseudonocardia sp. C8 TaxID=2762759 RepID=UPI001642791E|nr:allophanate hydrolase subunit 1 [Pseudonocardia sp. C8]MBC3191082.1 allophanate hydrolase subunit 1 [Pseudonocardia sp. C8]
MSGTVETVRKVGERGLLIELAAGIDSHRVAAWVRRHEVRAQLTEVVPAARTVFVLGDPDAVRQVAEGVESATIPEAESRASKTVIVPVRYDGPDLSDVAELTGLSEREVIEAHTGTEFTVSFFGFAPGQAFFAPLPDRVRVPRRTSPRTRVPSGSVAIANEFTIIYPLDSPGGWNLIGTRMGPSLWDVRAEPPNAVAVGDRVVFEQVR